MSIINNGLLLASGADAATTYQISRSLRFNSADSAYLSRTPGSAGNRRTFTVSCWVKRSALSSNQVLLSSNSNNSAAFELAFTSGDALAAYLGTGPNLVTSSVYRDCSAFYHIICAVDTTQSTASDRIKLYVNGTQITAFSASNYPSQNLQFDINNTTAHGIGRESGGTSYFNGYMADFYLLDGTATTPSTFAETDAVTGQWVPKTPTSISYGTNGFRLTFSDNSGTTSTTLGKDAAGSNNWTPNNFSVASGSGNDSLVDTPTSYGSDTGAGGEVRGNYATLNPLSVGYTSAQGLNFTLTNGNLDFSCLNGAGAAPHNNAVSTIAVSSGKWYAEFLCSNFGNTFPHVGIVTTTTNRLAAANGYIGNFAGGYVYAGSGQKGNNDTYVNYGASYTSGDLIGIALDLDAGTLVFYKNGVSQGTAYSGLSGSFYFAVANWNSGLWVANFGQRPFAYTAPSGFKALCDTNLPAPVVAKSSDYFQTVLYTGNGSTQTISGLGFSPDLVWSKSRSSTYSHRLQDTVRGATKTIYSNSTSAEETQSQGLTAFTSDGFTIGSDPGNNDNNVTYVAWAWDAGTSTVTNTQGSITSSVRANATAGFSVISYVGTGSAGASIGHGLGVAPAFALFKNRSVSSDWQVYHVSLGNAQSILLQSTAAAGSSSAFNSTSPTSTIITLGAGTSLNNNGSNHICYAFAPVVGYSSFGSYTGNGSSTDGPFVYTGFRPRWIMVKCTQDIAGDVEQWVIKDTARSSYNEAFDNLYANLSNAEDDASGSAIDILSNGFKPRGSYGGINGSATYIYAAFAESPLNYSRAR